MEVWNFIFGVIFLKQAHQEENCEKFSGGLEFFISWFLANI